MRFSLSAFIAALTGLVAVVSGTGAAVIGVFDGDSDVGAPKHAGAVSFGAALRNYKVTGGGNNMWFTNDALHFVWRKFPAM